ncbi:gamma-glutamylcyclotransferase family protein [Streptomyces sp. HUAS MG47]|uniref:gamma-glutamylcyclotransferase family protein n=1 Tax=Streptomyces solicamelliae TaxID=3231716 RepID=UPI003877B1E3
MRELPFFVYGTLRPGEPNHDRFLLGRTAAEEPARLAGALLYDGPGYPYATPGDGRIAGELVTAAPGAYGELLAVLDRLEDYFGPGHPRNLYERERRDVLRLRDGAAVPAWVYFAAPGARPGPLIEGGDWFRRPGRPGPPPRRRAPDGPRTP